MRATRTRWVGAITSAVPVITSRPPWFTQRQSNRISRFSGRFSRAVTVVAIVSPTPTGWRKRSDCAR